MEKKLYHFVSSSINRFHLKEIVMLFNELAYNKKKKKKNIN